jgi:hypothetical protein
MTAACPLVKILQRKTELQMAKLNFKQSITFFDTRTGDRKNKNENKIKQVEK